jgi:hypothetical protein
MSPAARHTDPETSHDAAKSVKDLTATQAAIVRILCWHGPMIDEEIVAEYRKREGWAEVPMASAAGIRTRRVELTREPHYLVVDTGARQKLASGRQSIVWGLREDIDGQS